MGLVDDQQRAVFLAGQLAAFLHKARLGQDHADVGHRRLAEQGAHIAFSQRGFQGGHIVERDRAAVLGQVIGLANQAGARHGFAVDAAHHHVIHRAVVAAVEHQQGFALGNGAGPAQHIAIRICCCGGHLPERQAEARGQQLAADHRVLARQHGGQAVVALVRQWPWRSGPVSGRTWCRCRPGRSRYIRGHQRHRSAPPWPARRTVAPASTSRPSSASARRRTASCARVRPGPRISGCGR